jgi:hypothetical protein
LVHIDVCAYRCKSICTNTFHTCIHISDMGAGIC